MNYIILAYLSVTAWKTAELAWQGRRQGPIIVRPHVYGEYKERKSAHNFECVRAQSKARIAGVQGGPKTAHFHAWC